jgi:hypothetical protein
MALSICRSCNRHVRGEACPFCGASSDATSEMPSSLRTAVVLIGAAAIASTACAMGGYGGPPPGDPANTPASSTADGGTD